MSEDAGLTDADMKKIETLRDAAWLPTGTDHVASCGCADCDQEIRDAQIANDALCELRRLDAVGLLLDEVRRLRARDADWQHATGHSSPSDFLTTHAWSDE